MERLTEKRPFELDYGYRIKELVNTEEVVQKLAEYEDAEEQGLLVKLPCKVGDTVYKPNPITLNEIVEIKIESIFITESRINISGRTTKMKYSFCCSPYDFDKTVFLTREEAEQALQEMKEV